MRNFSNPQPITLDLPFEESISMVNQESLDLKFEAKEVEEVKTDTEAEETTIVSKKESLSTEGLSFEEKDAEESPEIKDYDNNLYLQTINTLLEKGTFDSENFYEGFSEDTEPSPEVLEKFIEHNIQLREQQAITDLYEEISPLTQRLLEYDLNSKGKNIESFIKTLVEENSIKSLDPENEYDQEKIIRIFYKNEDFSNADIDEKIEDLKTAGLLSKEASKLKPKLDARVEAIARKEEENQKMLANIENQRKQTFYHKVEKELKGGKIDGIPLSKEDADRMIYLLFAEDIKIPLPEGREVRMGGIEAEVFKHKYSNNGDTKLLLKAALLLTNPDKFYKYFAQEVKTKEVNEFVKSQKYNITKSVPKQEVKEKKHVPWNRPK